MHFFRVLDAFIKKHTGPLLWLQVDQTSVASILLSLEGWSVIIGAVPDRAWCVAKMVHLKQRLKSTSLRYCREVVHAN